MISQVIEAGSALIRDGKFAVIHTGSFGAGWSAYSRRWKEMATDRGLAELILDGKTKEAVEYAKTKWPGCCTNGLFVCKLTWLPLGTAFRIHEYDGIESVVIYDPNDFHTVTGEEL